MDEEQSQVSTKAQGLSRGPYAQGDSQHWLAEFVLLFCVRTLYNAAVCVCLKLQMECEADNGWQETSSVTLRRRKLPQRQEELTPSTAAVCV